MGSLRLRLLYMLVGVLTVALGTVAVVTRTITATEFNRYVERNHFELRSAASQLVEMRGGRIVLANEVGHVLADTGGELVGRTIDEPTLLPLESNQPMVEHAVTFVAPKTAPPPELQTDVLVVRMAAPPELGGVPGEDAFVSAFNNSLLAAIAAGGVAAVVLAWLFSSRMLGPIDALTAAARRMEQGDLTQRVQVDSRDEIGELARAFNAMAGSLARNEHLRRVLVSDVAHELRTPLSNLRGYLEALNDGVASPTPTLIASLHEEAVLLSRLVNDLQELTLADAGHLDLDPEPLSLSEVIEGTVQSFRQQAEVQEIDLRNEATNKLPVVVVDRTRIGQVLRNLLKNALAYTSSGGQVVVTATATEHEIAVGVRDTGIGIAPDHLPHVFERFYRVDRSRDRGTGGTGIGLAIVRELVHAHGGRVAIDSTLGVGTIVTFSLPVSSPTALASPSFAVDQG